MDREFGQRAVITLSGILVTLAIGIADYISGPEVLLSLLYLVVIAPVAWWAGRGAGVVVALVAATVWTVAQISTSEAPPLVNLWNAASRAVIFAGGGLLVGTLREEQQRLRTVDLEREEFLAFMAHELRQPVAAIDVAASAVASSPGLSDAERRVITGLRSQARRLTGLAEDLLGIARLEGGLTLAPADVDLCEVADRVARDCEDPARVVVDRGGCPVLVRGDVYRITQAVDNLVSNALKYSPPGSPIRVAIAVAGERGQLEVRDQGVGIAPADVSRLFHKYGRLADPTRLGVQGSGLGLYLVRLIAEAHGGRVAVSSDGQGRGSTFTLELPRAPAFGT